MKTSLGLGLAAAVFFLTGCASVSVRGTQRRAEAAQRPAVIHVANFDTSSGDWKITSRSKTLPEFKADVSNLLAEALTAQLNAHVAPARRAPDARTAPPGGWLLTGRFTRVNEGALAARMLVGLGAGGSKMETETLVFDSATPGGPFLRFATTGGSNAMPGMLISSGPGGVVTNALQQANKGTRDDTKRTARMITASVAEYMAARGWSSNPSLKVKRPGSFQLLQPQGTPRRARVEAAAR
jgi:hypothetical protein